MNKYTLLFLAMLVAGNAAQAFDPEKCAALIELANKREQEFDKKQRLFSKRMDNAELWLHRTIAPKYCARKYSKDAEIYSRCITALVHGYPSNLPKGAFKELTAGDAGFYSDARLKEFKDKRTDEFQNIINEFKDSMKKIRQAYSKQGCP